MQDFIKSIMNALSQAPDMLGDPQKLHAAVVHLPIAIAGLGVLGLLALLFTGGRWHGLRWMLVVMYVIGMFTAWAADETGHDAVDMLKERGGTKLFEKPTPVLEAESDAPLETPAQKSLRVHEQLGHNLWIPMAVTVLFLILTAPRAGWIRMPSLLLALLASISTAAYVGAVAHHGGALVYEHGVGVPATEHNLTKPIPKDPTPPADSGKKESTGKDSKDGDKKQDQSGDGKTDKAGKKQDPDKTGEKNGTGKAKERDLDDPGPLLPGGGIFD